MSGTTYFTSGKYFMTCFLLVLVVFSTMMRFAGIDGRLSEHHLINLENTNIDYSLVNEIDNNVDTKKQLSTSDNQQEKEPLTLKAATSSDALLQGFVTTEFFQNITLAHSIEYIFPCFSSQITNSITYYFSSSTFFKILFSCFVSRNAP